LNIELYLKVDFLGTGWVYKRPIYNRNGKRNTNTYGHPRLLVVLIIGLASYWPWATDNSGTTTYGLTALALGREMSTPPTLQLEYGTLYLYHA